MLIRWGHISLLALLAIVGFFIAGGVRDAVSQDRNNPDAGADATAEGFVEAVGQVESADTISIRSEVPGTVTVVEVVPDGADVKKGDLIVQLDDSGLRGQLPAQEVVVAQARADLEQAQARLATQDAAADSNRETLALKLEIAELELRKYQDAELPLELQGSESRIKLAEERLAASMQRAERLESVIDEVAGARDDLDLVRVEIAEARADLDLARLGHRVLTEYDGPLETKKMELRVAEARLALEQVDQNSTAARVEAEAGLAAAELALANAAQGMETIHDAIGKCAIRAPRDGIVMHSVAYSRRATSNTLQAGSEVRQGQPLIQMPDLDRLRVQLAVDEEQVAAVKVGQSVSLAFGAFEELRSGTVQAVGQRQRLQVFPSGSQQPPRSVLVEFDEPPTDLRIGTVVRAAIDVSDAEDSDD